MRDAVSAVAKEIEIDGDDLAQLYRYADAADDGDSSSAVDVAGKLAEIRGNDIVAHMREFHDPDAFGSGQV